MRFESVRLIHAQGVPNHYIYNQVYLPTDEDHRKRGSFIVLIDHVNTKEGLFTASLVNTLIREYYRLSGQDLLGDFEQSLVRLNTQIQSYATTRNDGLPFELNGSIVLFANDEIHLSHIGTPLAYLWREDGLIKLSESENEAGPSTGFSMITSGEVKLDDVLILISSLNNTDTLSQDITFALKQTPIYEAGRAYARILKQKLERNAEAMVIHFNDADTTSQQVYVDRSLETLAEKFATYQEKFTHHSALVVDGGKFLVEKSKKLKKEPRHTDPTQTTEDTGVTALVHEESFDEFLGEEPDLDNDSKSTNQSIPLHDQATDDDGGPYQVRHYWQSDSPTPEESDAPPPTNTPEHTNKELPHETPVREASDVTTRITGFSMPRLKLKSRTVYVLVGVFFLLIVAIKAVNGVAVKSGAAPAKQTTQERDSIIEKAQAAFRDGETAQVQDNTTTAMANFVTTLDLLKTITEKNQNETSKTLAMRADKALNELTKTTQLPAGTKPQTINDTPKLITHSANGTFVFTNQSIQKYTGDTISPVANAPKSASIAATTYDERKKIAFITSDNNAYSLDTASGEVKPITRSDGQAWPASHAITSYQNNLYFVGDAMYKATPTGDKYKVVTYNKETSTKDITSIVNNASNAFFYAIEKPKTVLRIATNSPKNVINLSGLPDKLMPQTLNRIFTNNKDGLLYLFDADGQRILIFNDGGSYRQQYKLPTDTKYTLCDLQDNSLICTSENKQIKTFSL